MTERIDDLIVLGRGVPEQISEGRITVCCAGYSPSRGFIRIYPTRVDSNLKTWSIVSVEVERNPQDTRLESWKFPDSRNGWDRINDHIRVMGIYPESGRMGLMDRIKSNCVGDINNARLSLGVVAPTIRRAYLGVNQMHLRAHQPLFEFIEHSGIVTKRDYFAEPRLAYSCGPDCKSKNGHDMQLLEWGCYQWILRNPGKAQQLWENMGIDSDLWTHFFLVGNQARRRTSFMVISVLRQKVIKFQHALFA